jgi:AAA15 family ATPase/GTPase
MNRLILIALVLVSTNCFAQVPPINLFAQEYSKNTTEYLAKVFIARNVLNLKENDLVGFQIDAVTAAKSGELTTVLYSCPKLNLKGLVFAFYGYDQYSFKHFPYPIAKVLFERISSAVEDNKIVLDEVNTSALKSNDIHFIFASNTIRVVWENFDSDWTKSNFKVTDKRFEKFFK